MMGHGMCTFNTPVGVTFAQCHHQQPAPTCSAPSHLTVVAFQPPRLAFLLALPVRQRRREFTQFTHYSPVVTRKPLFLCLCASYIDFAEGVMFWGCPFVRAFVCLCVVFRLVIDFYAARQEKGTNFLLCAFYCLTGTGDFFSHVLRKV